MPADSPPVLCPAAQGNNLERTVDRGPRPRSRPARPRRSKPGAAQPVGAKKLTEASMCWISSRLWVDGWRLLKRTWML
jgi:hypothetical protein